MRDGRSWGLSVSQSASSFVQQQNTEPFLFINTLYNKKQTTTRRVYLVSFMWCCDPLLLSSWLFWWRPFVITVAVSTLTFDSVVTADWSCSVALFLWCIVVASLLWLADDKDDGIVIVVFVVAASIEPGSLKLAGTLYWVYGTFNWKLVGIEIVKSPVTVRDKLPIHIIDCK